MPRVRRNAAPVYTASPAHMSEQLPCAVRPRPWHECTASERTMELGIYTFAEMSPDPRTGRQIGPGAAASQPHGGDRARRPAWPRRLRRRRASPARLRGLGAGGRARRGGDADQDHPPDQRGQRALVRRSGARLPGVRHARSDLGRPRRDHGRAAARSSSRSRSSATTSRTTIRCSPRSFSCSSRSATARRSPGGASIARRSTIAASIRARRARSRSGSRSAARRNRRCAPGRSACRWRSPSSAASRSGSPPSSSSTARPGTRAGHDAGEAPGRHQFAWLYRRHLAARRATRPSRPSPKR